MQLRLFLLELLKLCLQLAGKYDIVHLCMPLDLSCQLIKLVIQILPVHDYLFVLVDQLRKLLLNLDDLLAYGDQLALVVLPAHLVLLELPEQ